MGGPGYPFDPAGISSADLSTPCYRFICLCATYGRLFRMLTCPGRGRPLHGVHPHGHYLLSIAMHLLKGAGIEAFNARQGIQ